MTTLGNENLRAETAKKRAHAIKTRLEALGHPVSLSHGYEVLATSCGHRNWPTMKAGLDNVEPTHGVEKTAPDREAPASPFLGSTNTKVIMRREEDAVVRAVLFACCPSKRLELGEADDITSWIAGKICDRGAWGAEWKGRLTAFLTGLIRALVYHRDRHGQILDVHTIRANLPIGRYVTLAYEVMRSEMPEGTRRMMSTYLSACGYVEDAGSNQPVALKEKHGYLEAMTSDALQMIETEMKWERFTKRLADI
ncbi:hypothetical protein HFO56_03275 [Rhizobium laguerreae]|uniref:glyoxalase superfamily protein n=1 Tax=Rhizobium laguerreae TaxID=1076926 RepID=UPI001C920B1B|nr:glyoxalase superfamily protein [Rhizobium laguerreae]MBY3151409.1 hypothetical protein [Rhizobium laguerreae]